MGTWPPVNPPPLVPPPPDPYTPQSLGIEPPIQLKSAEDRLEIQYADPALNHTAVLYLRLARSVAR
jgi:hypothetical protein